MRTLQILGSLAVLALVASCDEIEEHAWCNEICDKLRECADDELGVDACSDRCDDAIDEGDVREAEVEDCAQCVDDTICRDIGDECNVCDDVLPAFTSRDFG